jgi:uncharacterized membrane protein YjjP (DUF1212 family)
MNVEERSAFVLTAAKALYVSGQSTGQTIAATERLADVLGLRTTLLLRWSEIVLQVDSAHGALIRLEGATPTGIDMNRVASVMRAIDELAAGHLTPEEAAAEIETASHAPPAPTWLFAIAAAAGAAALSVIYGVYHLAAAALIAGSGGMGAVLRRRLAHLSDNAFLQPLCAGLLAGVVGALAVRYQLNSSLRLVALCPCMILVPGPHLLNGGIDLIHGRIHLGASRILFAILVVVAIATGLLCGSALLGSDIPVEPAGRGVPLWQDAIAAGVAVAAFSIFFSTPFRLLPWPVVVGALAHGLRWCVMTGLGFGPVGGAFVACLTVGLILTPVAKHWQLPFAAIGYSSVVSMMPGVYLFRAASGAAQMTTDGGASAGLVSGTLSDGVLAAGIVLAMCVGLLLPNLVLTDLGERIARRKSGCSADLTIQGGRGGS